MTAPWSVSPDAISAALGGLPEVMASMRRSLVPATATPDLLAIDGDAGWPDRVRAALGTGIRGLMIVDPDIADPGDIRQLANDARAAGVVVEVDSRWASDPAVAPFAERVGAAGRSGTADLVVTVPSGERGRLPRVLAATASALAAVVGPLHSASGVSLNSGGMSWVASAGPDWRVIAALVVTDAAPHGLRLRLIDCWPAADLEVGEPDSARPALARLLDDEGEILLPTRYESGHRASWRRLVAGLSGGPVTEEALEALAAAMDGLGPLVEVL